MACNCCAPTLCCPNGDPVKWTAVLSGTVVYSSGARFLESIASSLLGTYVLNPTVEQVGGSGKYYSIGSDDISTIPNAQSSWFSLSFDGRVWGYGALGCVGGPVPTGNIAQMAKKAAANANSGSNVIVQMAIGGVSSLVTGTDCVTDATASFTNYVIDAYSVTYTSGGVFVSSTSGSYRCNLALTLNF